MSNATFYKGSKSGRIQKADTQLKKLEGDFVRLRITASGVCGTDLHYRTQPMALGHEGVGIVEETGPAVKHLQKGDRVGWGYVHDTCGECEHCLTGMDTFCWSRAMYGEADLDQGSFGTGAVWREAFLFKVPDSIADEHAAPLQCGGATVFGALEIHNVKSTDRVGIIGVGGLGHLAIQFASKKGCDVVVFSGTESKKDEAMELGASSFYAMKDKKPGDTDIGRPLDALIVTASALPDWSLYIPLLNRGAKIFPLSVAEGDFAIPHMQMMSNGLVIQNSLVAPRLVHQRMLEFAAHHGIKPMVEKFEMSEKGIEEAMEKLDAGKLRYRAVLLNKQ
ncbi:GroES-like protein [Pseudovirgaria hyperparasitica]|uniref:GroES-like protein n=1 Tax=Pseudovirgaria hyperparasitica TaxID=470096 RepID=A0A6A6VUX5_9PEZI|nr:GroES-like protein [Pseudovirgaria hyperparasitica]KAF2753524.1 GroES-like protein [Pseudovirgaria hyperparasitica]